MKLAIRCVLAIVAVVACITLIRDDSIVRAQSCCTQNYCLPPQPNCPNPACDYLGGCSYAWACDSPILIDLKAEGFHLTDQANGVSFKFYGDAKRQVAWTDPKYANAWLALDRNDNGMIDDATELFGNLTAQPASPDRNGFLALAVYDSPDHGGNNDGYITPADSIYPHLLVWTDKNHNGISEPDELQHLDHAGVISIALDYSEAHWEDRFHNIFRYRGSVRMDAVPYDHQIYDVYLTGTN